MNDHNDLQTWLDFDDLDIQHEEERLHSLRCMVAEWLPESPAPAPARSDLGDDLLDGGCDMLAPMTEEEMLEEAELLRLDIGDWIRSR